MFKVHIRHGAGGKIERHKGFSGSRTLDAAERYFQELCNTRTQGPAEAILSRGNMIKKSYRLDIDWQGDRLTQDSDPLR